jgi:RIO-like serine/threonine protein kinase
MAAHHSQHPNEPPIAPNFLGHLTENGITMGFLLQKVDGEPACVNDLANCEAVLHRLHRLGMIHGDVNRYNFLVDRVSGSSVRLVDFEHAQKFE